MLPAVAFAETRKGAPLGALWGALAKRTERGNGQSGGAPAGTIARFTCESNEF
jgi:hypothetical protein